MSTISKKVKVNPITPKQKELLVDFISNKTDMYTGKFTPTYTKEKMKAYWEELANILNSLPDGTRKDWKQWRKTWVDLKKNTKAKFVEQKMYSQGTGGGPPLPPSEIDSKLLKIITPVAVSGNTNIQESTVQFFMPEISLHQEEVVLDNESSVCDSISAINLPCEENMFMVHDYCLTSPSTSTAQLETPKKLSGVKRKKITKTTRLQESLKHNEKFIEITEKNMECENNFRQTQTEIMQRDSKIKENYYTKKLEVLQVIANAAKSVGQAMTQIAQDFTDIKKKLCE